MRTQEETRKQYEHYGDLSCYFSNGHKCFRPCLEHCIAYDQIELYEQVEKEIWEKEQELEELQQKADNLSSEIFNKMFEHELKENEK